MIKDNIKYQPEPLEIVDGVNADSVQELLMLQIWEQWLQENLENY